MDGLERGRAHKNAMTALTALAAGTHEVPVIPSTNFQSTLLANTFTYELSSCKHWSDLIRNDTSRRRIA